MVDLLVIGAGLAGLAAALRASELGLKVKVIAKGHGALYWSSGSIDVLGYVDSTQPAVERPWEQIADLGAEHPYRRLGAERVCRAVEWFAGQEGVRSLGYAGNAAHNQLLPTPAGAWRPTYLAPAGQRAGERADLRPLVVVGLQGMRDFYPHLIARNLQLQGQTVRAVQIPWSVVSEQRDRNTAQLAECLDDPQSQQRLAGALQLVVQPGERVGLPAILGRHAHPALLALLGEQLGSPVFEIPTLPPNVPGIRLAAALRQQLQQRGVRVEIGMEGVGFRAQAGEIQWVESATSARPLVHRARAFLLATGGVLGGGFDSDHTGRFWETLFDLPLTVPQERQHWFRPHFLDPRGQPALHGGVAVDVHGQPVDAQGRVVYTNLWAAGCLLAGTDPVLERSMEGVALASAVAAAERIAGLSPG
jgi:glycerol-3-phosphate dehydrogenase subunit B